jgi:hypothetical protein
MGTHAVSTDHHPDRRERSLTATILDILINADISNHQIKQLGSIFETFGMFLQNNLCDISGVSVGNPVSCK